MAGGDGTRRGLFPQPAPIAPRPLRTLSAPSAIQASVVFDAEDRAFVADMGGNVQALSLQGKTLWRTTLPGGISATPVVHPTAAQIYVGTHQGWVCALDSATGAVLWKKLLPTKADPRILSDLLFVPESRTVILSSWGGRFFALDASTGAERFAWDAGLSPSASACAGPDGTVYCLRCVSNRGVQLVRVTADGGETVLHQAPEDQRGARRTLVAAAPVLDSGRDVLYFVVNHEKSGSLNAWSLRDNALLWRSPLPHTGQATPAVRKDGLVIIPDLAGLVHALGPDGAFQFQYSAKCDYLLAGAVSEAGGTSYVGDPLGFLHAIDRLGAGKPIFEAKRAVEGRPSFDRRGSLYLPATDRHVYVFASTATSAAPAPG